MELAARRAVKRARNGEPYPDFKREVHQSRLDSCFRRGWVNVGRDKERAERDGTDKPFIYVTAEGLRRVNRWLREGMDASDTEMSPEWRARLRHLYG